MAYWYQEVLAMCMIVVRMSLWPLTGYLAVRLFRATTKRLGKPLGLFVLTVVFLSFSLFESANEFVEHFLIKGAGSPMHALLHASSHFATLRPVEELIIYQHIPRTGGATILLSLLPNIDLDWTPEWPRVPPPSPPLAYVYHLNRHKQIDSTYMESTHASRTRRPPRDRSSPTPSWPRMRPGPCSRPAPWSKVRAPTHVCTTHALAYHRARRSCAGFFGRGDILKVWTSS